jgi:flagellar basal body-associated protein FliL
MADEAEETPPLPPRKPGGLFMNAIVVFVMTLLAVIVGGFVNVKLHPLPDHNMNKDGLITAVVPAPAAAHGGGDGGGGKTALYYAIDPPMVVNFEDGSVVRFLQITMGRNALKILPGGSA